MIKNDCFAIKGNKCIALKELYCRYEECGFYKTKLQYNKDIEKSNERLRQMPPVELNGLADKYEVLAKMLSL